VILSGIIMPRMDGFALKESLVKNVVTSSIPFMILSHMGRQEDKTKAESLGVKDFFVFGMITPLEIVKKIKIESGSKEYTLQLNTELLDASKLVNDFKLGENLKCPKCSNDLNLKLKVSDVLKREFLAKLICPKCDVS
jgi:PleD family two-component response regulator